LCLAAPSLFTEKPTHAAEQYSTANFSLSSDGYGGTIVLDPALVGSAASPVLAAPQA